MVVSIPYPIPTHQKNQDQQKIRGPGGQADEKEGMSSEAIYHTSRDSNPRAQMPETKFFSLFRLEGAGPSVFRHTAEIF